MVNTNTREMLRAVGAYYDQRLSRAALSFVVRSYSGSAMRSEMIGMPQHTFTEVINFVNEGLNHVLKDPHNPPLLLTGVDTNTGSVRILPVGSAYPANYSLKIEAWGY